MDPLKLVRYAFAGWVPGGNRACAACGQRVWRFMPYRDGSRGVPPLIRALDGIGSDVDHFECPRCGAHDRERHLLLYMRAAGLFEVAVSADRDPGRLAQYRQALGWSYLRTGRAADAREQFTLALKIDPSLQSAREGLLSLSSKRPAGSR